MSKREKIYLRVVKGALVPADISLWKTPIGYPDWVVVSPFGDVFLMQRKAVRGGFAINLKPKLLKQKNDGRGYLVVQFRIGGKNTVHRIHRLVMIAHSGESHAYLDVNHKNGNKADNRIENLEWCTRSENINHSYRVLGRVAGATGKIPHNKGKLNDPRTSKKIIGTPVNGGDSISFKSASDAGRNGFSRDGIAHCLIGEQKTANGYFWRFAE